jgi:glycosyltransferase involved in cell wall biosynthesis
MKNEPLVSVVMTAWNRESLIHESISSILAQTYNNIELIVVDDGSTDGTSAAVEAFKDTRIRLFRRPHMGIVRSANYGIAQARGQFIARLDSDDLSLPSRIQLQVKVLAKHPAAVLCFSDCTFFGGEAANQSHGRFCRSNMLIVVKMCLACPLVHSSIMYRKDAFERAGGYLPSTPVAEDYSLYTRLAFQGVFVGIPQKLVAYRIHSSSSTQKHLAIMKQLTREIAVQHMISYFQFGQMQAGRYYEDLNRPFHCRSLALWMNFCRHVLSRRQCWQFELLAWMTSQTVKMLLGKISFCRRRENVKP